MVRNEQAFNRDIRHSRQGTDIEDIDNEDRELEGIKSMLKNVISNIDEKDNQKPMKEDKQIKKLHKVQADIEKRKEVQLLKTPKRKIHKRPGLKLYTNRRKHTHMKPKNNGNNVKVTSQIPTKSATTTSNVILPYLERFHKHGRKYHLSVSPQPTHSSIFQDKHMWMGVAAGAAAIALFFLIAAITCWMIRRYCKKDKCIDLKNLSLCDIDSGKMRDPVYIRLSQLHDPRKGPQYVVSVLDQSNNFAINTSSSSSEEEIFNIQEKSTDTSMSSHQNSMCSNYSNRSSKRINRTSTPIKTPVRLNKSSLSALAKKQLSFTKPSPQKSPLAMTSPYLSPVKKINNG